MDQIIFGCRYFRVDGAVDMAGSRDECRFHTRRFENRVEKNGYIVTVSGYPFQCLPGETDGIHDDGIFLGCRKRTAGVDLIEKALLGKRNI